MEDRYQLMIWLCMGEVDEVVRRMSVSSNFAFCTGRRR